ncbi:prepilin peptidase [Candidatus Nomurabacteria bacterium]|nr:prepilin peptidase [Candidatus Nomurabacteria bacterium]
MLVAFVFILGLFVGSFLNVVIYRLHRAESFVKGFSKCLFCGHRLFPQDLVPLFSFVFLKGKCRYCKTKISWQYFLVELATAIGFVLIFWKIFQTNELAIFQLANLSIFAHLIFWWIIFAFLLLIFVYDLKYYLILDKVSLPAIAFAFVVNLFFGFSWLNLLLAAAVGGGFFLLQFVLSNGKWIGGGDVRIGLLMGMILGWPQVLTALFLAYVLGGLFASGLLIFKKKHWGDKLPFGTFLTLATFIVLLYGETLINFYWSFWKW